MSAAEKLTRAEQKAQRRLEIVDAAFEEFAKNGFTATRVEDIAHRVAVRRVPCLSISKQRKNFLGRRSRIL